MKKTIRAEFKVKMLKHWDFDQWFPQEKQFLKLIKKNRNKQPEKI